MQGSTPSPVTKHPQLVKHGSFSHLKLGRIKPDKPIKALRLDPYVKPEALLPQIPTEIDWTKGVLEWPMYGNDEEGDCTCAAAGHLIQGWSAAAGNPKTPADGDILQAYIPGTGTDDTGRVETDVLNYWQNVGIGGDKILGWVSINAANLDLVRAGIALFGGVYAGIQLPTSAQAQAVWDVVPGMVPGSWGGHAVPYLAYNSGGFICITWAHPLVLTYNFHNACTDEVYACLSEDFLNSQGETPEGLNLDALRGDLIALKDG